MKRNFGRQFDHDKSEISRSTMNISRAYDNLYLNSLGFIAELFPYVTKEERKSLIDSSQFIKT